MGPRPLFFDGEPVLKQAEFIRRATDGCSASPTNTANEISDLKRGQILVEYQSVQRELGRAFPSLMQPAARDMREQLAHLVYKGFLTHTPHEWLIHMPRLS